MSPRETPPGMVDGQASTEADAMARAFDADEHALDQREEPAWRTWLIRGVALVTLAYTIVYLAWRWTETLNPDALWFSIPLVVAETWSLVMFCGLVFTAWSLRRRRRVEPPEGMSVAVFITTYDEPVPVLRKTVVAAREIRYPHETYVLDDGCREEVRLLAERLGVRYIRRESSEHAKAGNLNNALGLTEEDFILQLDADHVPLPHILDRLLGYFTDERVAFVQSPQDFYNLDSYTHVVDHDQGRVWEEQRIFFDIIQPGKDRWNAAFFCGSCGVVRRAALEDIGGFSTETITEDVETSLLLHGRGWRSVYVEESLAFGLSPGSAGAYQVQRLRWGQGSMQILRKFNPLTLPGLTLAQRASYLLSLVHYFDGLQRVVFLGAPLVFFFTGALPVEAVDFEFLARFFPFLFLNLVSFELLTRGRGYLWLAERYNMAKWPVYIRALWGLVTTRRLSFEVTPKGDQKTPVKVYLPQLAVLVISPVALVWATVAYRQGWIAYDVPGWRSAAFIVNAGFLAWNAYFAWAVVKQARSLRQEEDYRFREEVPVRFHLAGVTGPEAKPSVGITREIAPRRLRLASATPLDVGDRVAVQLPLSTGLQKVTGTVITRAVEDYAGLTLHDVMLQLEDPPVEVQIAIELHCVHHAVPTMWHRLLPRPDLFEDVRLWWRERRGQRREPARFPVQLGLLGDGRHSLTWQPGVLEDLSEAGARVTTESRVEEGSWVRFHVPGAELAGEGMVVRVSPIQTSRGCRWSLGIERSPTLQRNPA